MSGSKTLVNDTGAAVSGSLSVRKGSDPSHQLKVVPFSLEIGETKTIQYGDDQNPFLNGMDYEYKLDGELVGINQQVITRGSTWDDIMNTNNTLTLNAVQQPVQGSNR